MAEPPRYRRNEAVRETEIDGEIFLVEPDSEEVYYLDRTGSALWRLLDEARRFDDILAVFHDAFPDVAAAALRRDLRRALDALVERGLASLAPDGSEK